jgi:hypothetical protein
MLIKFTRQILSLAFLCMLGTTMFAQNTGACLVPTVLSGVPDSNQIVFNWQPATPNASYTIEYVALPTNSSSSAVSVTSTTNSYTLKNLAKCKEYAFRVKTNCSPTVSSIWSSYKTVKTTGCVPTSCPKAVFALSADSTKIKVSWTSVGTNTYQIEYSTPPASGSTVTPTWTPVTATTSPVTISGLANCKEYRVRVRTKCTATLFSDWETKSIKTLGCAPTTCPKAVFALSSDSTKIKVSWTSVGTNTYQIEYSTPAAASSVTPTWTPVTATTSPATISGLLLCKEYVIRMRTVCSNTLFSDWEYKSIKTLGCGTTNCPKAPFTLSADSTKIKVSWTNLLTNSYQIEYATLSASGGLISWIPVTTTTSPLTITGLDVCKEYYVYTRTNCGNNLFSGWETKSIKTLGCAPTSCPKAVFTLSADSSKIKVSWASVGTNTYQIEYSTPAASGSTVTPTWTPVTATTSPVTITGLAVCKEYVVRVRTKCTATLFSDWETKSIKTLGCASTNCPKAVFTLSADSTKIKVSWTSVGTNTYQIEYSTPPASGSTVTPTWTPVTATTSPVTISGLAVCKEYLVRVRTKCSATLFSDWETKSIKTLGCASTNCPKAVFALSADSTKIKVSWASVGTNTYQIEYSTPPASGSTVTPTWTPVTATASPVTITGLAVCKEYLVRVRTKCSATLFSDWETKSIKTLGCAPTTCPKAVFALSADSSKIKVSWTSVGTNTYQIEYTAATGTTVTPTWIPVTATTSPVTISGLANCKEYVVRVRTKCSATLFSDWETKSIKTLGCALTNCPKAVFALSADSSKIKVSWTSVGTNTYQVEYSTPPASGTTVTPTWTPVTATTSPVTISGLANCKEYLVRVRTKCSATLFSEWETKSIKTLGCASTNCPKAVFALSADSTKIKVSWASVGTNTYQIEYSTPPASGTTVTPTWTPVTATTSPVTISGLANCKEYRVRVRTKCSSDFYSDWETKSIKTLGCTVTTPCAKPSNLTSNPISGGVVLNWQGSASTYDIRYSKKTAGVVTWITVNNVNGLTYTITGLESCAFYAWQVRAKCVTAQTSDWSNSALFETGGCNNRSAKVMTLSPNPGTYLNIDYNLNKTGKVAFEITNLQGKVVAQIDLGVQQEGVNHYSLNDLQIPAGTYIVTIKLNGARTEVQRWAKTTE